MKIFKNDCACDIDTKTWLPIVFMVMLTQHCFHLHNTYTPYIKNTAMNGNICVMSLDVIEIKIKIHTYCIISLMMGGEEVGE